MIDLFRTRLDYGEQALALHHQSSCLFVGSCFSENIANKLKYYGFKTKCNPFGILYNAHSISKCLHYIASSQTIEPKDLIFHNECWHSKWHHGSFSAPDQKVMMQKCNVSLQDHQEAFQYHNCIFITLGTAFIYRLKSSDEVVGNCHKMPQNDFIKSMMPVEDVVQTFAASIKEIINRSPKMQFVFTISPVRHLRDGFVENQLSKSTLTVAVHELVKRFSSVHYFPAYELVMDDLRDYRFYKADMLHPNEQAVDYIWSRFKHAFIAENSYKIMDKIEGLRKMQAHKALHPQTEQHQQFLKKLEEKKKTFKAAHPEIDLDA